MTTIYNFGAGPATLPKVVLERAQEGLLNWQGSHMSVMEFSHRSPEFVAMTEKVEKDLRALLAIPDNYHVLFLQGGGQAQFALVPLNLLGDKTSADYIDTGIWSSKACEEASRYCDARIVASSNDKDHTYIPAPETWQCDPDAAYFYYAANETINGVEFPYIPETGNVPLVTDMSSNILSQPVDIAKFGVIYACAQKNVGPSGITLVIVRDDLLGKASDMVPSVFNYTKQQKMQSLYNTPPTFAWYMVGLMCDWLKDAGGLATMDALNRQKSQKIYDLVDASDFYINKVDPACRSRMNVPFQMHNPELDSVFLQEANAAGMRQLKGHRLYGGMRASVYNAMPMEGVDALVDFMQDFERRHG